MNPRHETEREAWEIFSACRVAGLTAEWIRKQVDLNVCRRLARDRFRPEWVKLLMRRAASMKSSRGACRWLALSEAERAAVNEE